MIQIDNVRMWESFLNHLQGKCINQIAIAIGEALIDQSLKYDSKNKKIISIDANCKIEEGKYYKCLKSYDGYEAFTEGKIYHSLYDNSLIDDCHKEVKIVPPHNFTPVTKEELQKYTIEHPLVGEFDFPDYKPKQDTSELTEFEEMIEAIADPTALNAYGVKGLAERLRKKIAEEIDVEEMVKDYRSGIAPAVYESAKDLQAFCFQTGIEYTIKKIKGE